MGPSYADACGVDSASSAWCNGSRPGGTGTAPLRIFSGVASLPYAFSLAASCALTLAPARQPRCHTAAILCIRVSDGPGG